MQIDIDQVTREYVGLKLMARDLNDVMKTRIRAENRIHADMLRTLGDDCPGRGTTEFSAYVADEMKNRLLWARDDTGALKRSGLLALENDIHKMLVEELKVVSGPHLQTFIDTPGIGLKLIARLLGEIGHPCIAQPMRWEEHPDATGGDDPKRTLVADPPYLRMVSQLWTYCGHGKALKKSKGMDANDAMALGNPQSKMFTYLLAESCMKTNGSVTKNGVQRALSPFRATYDEAKARYEITRPDPEKGEKESAERWTKGHRHAAALRITGKAILKELWIASKADLALSTGGDFELTDEANPRDVYNPLAA